MRFLAHVLILVFLSSAPWYLWPDYAITHEAIVIDPDNVPKVWIRLDDHECETMVPPCWGTGSGVVVAPLVVLTARHVVRRGREESSPFIEVEFPGGVKIIPKVWCASQPETDFAILSMLVPNPAHTDHVLPYRLTDPKPGDIVTIAGWPRGNWATASSVVMYESHDNPIRGDGETVRMPHIWWVDQPDPRAGYFGYSGGGVFSQDGMLLGIICCVNMATGFMGYVPLRYGLKECPLEKGSTRRP